MEIRKLVIFAILMENNDGIIGKTPDYVMEKWRSASQMDRPEMMLDSYNLAKLEAWDKKWFGKR